MVKMVEITCSCGCGRKKKVREADVKRGWGKFYSKSCKAREQERRTGQYKSYINRKFVRTKDGCPVDDNFVGITDQDHDIAMIESELGWDCHEQH